MIDPVLDRQVRRRLEVLRHVEEVSGNVSMTCRYFGISWQVYYTWLRRYEAEGVDGLRDRSKRPRTSPNATRAEVVDKIIHLRQHYHFGPAKIATYLKRYHDIEISTSGVWRILHRLDMGRLPASRRYKRHDRRWKRYESSAPATRYRSTSSSLITLAVITLANDGLHANWCDHDTPFVSALTATNSGDVNSPPPSSTTRAHPKVASVKSGSGTTNNGHSNCHTGVPQ